MTDNNGEGRSSHWYAVLGRGYVRLGRYEDGRRHTVILSIGRDLQLEGMVPAVIEGRWLQQVLDHYN